MTNKFQTTINLSVSMHEALPLPIENSSLTEDVYVMPATQGQIRFWSLDQLHPGNPALNMPLMWQCRGELNVDLLAFAFSQAVRRHEILRTTFAIVDDKLSQIIGPGCDVSVPLVDLQHLQDAATSVETGRLIREHAAISMDLRDGPLLAVKLLKFSPLHHLLLVTMHHIICDGISLGILLRDIAVFYEALVQNKEAKLPELPIQFADFAVWQEDWRKSAAAEESRSFWRKSLGKEFTSIQIKRDPPRETSLNSADDSATGDIETLLISPELTKAAHQFCIREGVTLNILLFTVFCAMLNRITGQKDLVIGSPCANRTEETEELIGLFMNIQVLRLRLQPQETFETLLRQVQDWTVSAYENQKLPFEDLVYDPYFSQASNAFEIPIFFLYQKSFMITHRVAGLEIVPLRSMSPGAVFEMMFAIVDRAEEGPRLQLEYNPQYYRRTTIQQFLKLFIDLLESGLKVPSVWLEEMEVRERFPLRFSSAHTSEVDPSYAISQTRKSSAKLSGSKDPIESQLLDLWKTTLGIDVGVDTSLFSLGVSSLTILRLVTRMNKLYSMNFGLASLFSAPNIKMLAGLVRQRYAPNTTSSLVPIQSVGNRPSLYIVHGAGGNVVNFYGLSTRVGTDQPVYGVQAQALQTGKPGLLRMEDLAAHYLQEIRKIQPHGPYYLLGYSFGGIVVSEMAYQLCEAGETIGLIGMLDTRTKDYLPTAMQQANGGLKKTAKSFENLVHQNVEDEAGRTWFERFYVDLRERRIRYVTTFAAKFFKTIPAFLKDTHEINSVAARKYQLKRIPGRLNLFRAAQQSNENIPFDNGWTPYFTEGVEIHEIPGDHWHVLYEPGIDILAQQLRDCMR